MHDNAMSRWLSPLMAFCLSFLIIATLAPIVGIQVERQFDFWALWLVTMVILALPLVYLEVALAKRAKTTPLQALATLTRDADASPKWRLVGWLSVVFIPFLVGGILSNSSLILAEATDLSVAHPVLVAGCLAVALIASLIPRLILVLVTTVSVLAALLMAQFVGQPIAEWQITPLEFSEWGSATVLALIASGLGLGIYWQSHIVHAQKQDVATRYAFPTWIAQLIAVIAFGFFAATTPVTAISLAVTAIVGSALLMNMAREQLAQRQLALPIQWIICIVAAAIWVIPQTQTIFNNLLMFWGLIICLIYALFAGWIMKISHLRKSMNFGSEISYNIWRIAVRIVLPVSILLALIALIGKLL